MPWGAFGVVEAGKTNARQCTIETGMCKFSGQEVTILNDVCSTVRHKRRKLK